MKPSITFHAFGLLFSVPGAGLLIFCGYILYRNLHPVFYWKKTTGEITGVVERFMGSGDDSGYHVFEKATFTDHHGKQNEVIAIASAGSTETDFRASGRVTIFYDPQNPGKAMIFFWRDYVPLIMLPFGMFLVFLGWPFEKRRDG